MVVSRGNGKVPVRVRNIHSYPTMTPDERHLQAAIGFLELGMPLDANDEVEAIEPARKTLSEVLAVRVEVFRALSKWQLMEVVARQLAFQQPDEPQNFISLAFATRRAIGVQEALAVLARVANRFPACATILYNLACYAAVLGHLDVARNRLAEATKLESAFRKMALNDPDLSALHDELR